MEKDEREILMRKRKLLVVAAALCLLVATAFAAGRTITLDSAKPMQGQIEQFKEWYAELPLLERAAWDMAFLELSDPQAAGASFFASSATDETEVLVWIPKSGKRYHSNANCSNMNNPTQVSLDDAISKGFTPCKRCN